MGQRERARPALSSRYGPADLVRRAGPPAADVPVADALDAGPAHPSLYLGDLVGARAHRRQDRRPFGRAEVLWQRLAVSARNFGAARRGRSDRADSPPRVA